MTLPARLAALALCFSAAACGRSDLFSARGHTAGAGGGGGGAGTMVTGGGGFGGRGTSPDGGADGPAACAAKIEICDNGIDDNCNNMADCDDPSCLGDRACVKVGVEICNNGLDDDADGLVDCADPDCATSVACRPVMGTEICDNQRDDNGDGLVDCADPQCTTAPSCLLVRCQVDVDFGAIAAHGASVTRTLDTTGSTAAYATCAPAGGHGRVGSFSLAATTDVQLAFSQPSTAAHVVALFRAGANQACDQNLVECLVVGQAAQATHTFAGLAPGVYRVIVESYPGTTGATTVTLSTGSSTRVEVCNNGIDDDGNGLVDCQDSACTSSALCTGSECVPDTTVGALVVGAAPKAATINTTTSQNRYHPLCAGASVGADRSVAFTLAQPGGVEVAFQQSGDHTFALFNLPPAGQACDASPVSCFYPGTRSGDFAVSDQPAGRYLLVAKAVTPAQEGVLSLRLSAFANRGVEVCNNGVDDDGDGLVDCDDPDCFGVGACMAGSCVPDTDLGTISWGSVKSLSVDVTSGKNLYQTSCGRGDGKQKVLRLTLAQPMALGFECTDSGSDVFELSQQQNPLDSCTANDVSCGDPQVLPFGCNYAVPNLQPGVYNLVVEAFRAGTEGVVQLTLQGLAEPVREICDNGIDDDMDGATDCADLKCVTQPECAKFACRADDSLGLLPLDGTLETAVVQTSTGGDDQTMTPCVSGPGGQDQVVNFRVPALADLTVQWAQLGNHVLAIYPDNGVLLACDAAASVACFPTNGVASGQEVFPRLPMGSYHLVVDAARAGAESGVVLELSAVPSP